MASISSKKIRQAFLDRAIWKSSRTILAPSPTYFCTSSLPMTLMKQASVLLATALARRVFPAVASHRFSIFSATLTQTLNLYLCVVMGTRTLEKMRETNASICRDSISKVCPLLSKKAKGMTKLVDFFVRRYRRGEILYQCREAHSTVLPWEGQCLAAQISQDAAWEALQPANHFTLSPYVD